MFLTDLLFSSPHLHFSTAQKAAVLAWGKDMQAQDVPTMHALKKCRESVKKELGHIGNPTQKEVSSLGTVWYGNDPALAAAMVRLHYVSTLQNLTSQIIKDMANPSTRPHLQLYPVEKKIISQTQNAEKALGGDIDASNPPPVGVHPPMVIKPGIGDHYFTNELSQLKGGQFFIPIIWFQKESDGMCMWAKGFKAKRDSVGCLSFQ